MSDPTLKELKRWGAIAGALLSFCLGIAAAGWKAKDYADQIISHIDLVSQKTEANTQSIELLRKHGWTDYEMERWGIQLERGNRNLAVTAGSPGLYVPPVPTSNDQSGITH